MAYQKQYEGLAQSLVSNVSLPPGPPLPNLLKKQVSFKTGVVFDGTPLGKVFGQVLSDVKPQYNRGERAIVTFVAGHPRNNLMLESTYLTVEKLNNDGTSWTVVATDGNWETRFYWRRKSVILGHSEATVMWEIPQNAVPGIYRIRHVGHSKNILQVITRYEGSSSRFKVNP